MKISAARLTTESESSGFRPDVLEKVANLLGLLDALQRHPLLKKKLVLKGGTALNLFIFKLPRLSVDIDLNYIGAVERELMQKERPTIAKAVKSVFKQEGYAIRRSPKEQHAGGKWSLRYHSVLGQGANLEVDINLRDQVDF